MPLRAMQDGIWPFEVDGEGRMRPALMAEECRGLLEKYVRAYRAGVLPRASGTGGVEVQVEQYQNGDIALLSTGTNMLERIYDSAPKVYEKTRVLPGVTGRLGWRDIATMVLSVGGQSKRPDLATRLAVHITSNKAQMELARMVGIIPSTVAALADEHFAAPSAAEMAQPKGKIRLCRHLAAEGMKAATSFYPAVSVWPELATAFDQKMKGVLVDGADYLKTLAEIEVVWGRIMARAPVTSSSAMPTRVAVGDFQRSKL
jgi:putative chitobiose transport system substrate-binding protein